MEVQESKKAACKFPWGFTGRFCLFGKQYSIYLNAFKRWQRRQHFFAITGRGQAAVEYGHASHVAFGADEATHGLYQLDAGFGHGDFHKRVAALVGNPIAERFVYGIVGHGKRQLGDDDVHAGKPWQVQALGETV